MAIEEGNPRIIALPRSHYADIGDQCLNTVECAANRGNAEVMETILERHTDTQIVESVGDK
jgi:hypothetical protein